MTPHMSKEVADSINSLRLKRINMGRCEGTGDDRSLFAEEEAEEAMVKSGLAA